jgi:hypothetical protein
LIGTVDANVILYDVDTKKSEFKYNCKRSEAWDEVKDPDCDRVIDLIWNPGEDNFLVLFKDSKTFLLAQDDRNHKFDFEKQTVGISKIAWIDNVSGDFITSSIRVGALRLWNAS